MTLLIAEGIYRLSVIFLTSMKGSPMLPRILPFTLFMAFIGLDELVRFLAAQGFFALSGKLPYFLYPIKAITVALVLAFCWSRYQEIRLRDLARFRDTSLSLFIGVVVFVLWIRMDWSFGKSRGNAIARVPLLLSSSRTSIAFDFERL